MSSSDREHIESAGAPPSPVAEIFGGAGIGLLVGLLVGLSASDVVGGVIAGLTAVLVAFLGLRPAKSSGQTYREQPWRLGTFGIVCALALLGGLSIRGGDILTPTPRERLAAWTEIGVPAERARELAVYQALGLVPEGEQIDSVQQRYTSSALFAGESTTLCPALESTRFEEVDERLYAFGLEEGGWQLAARIASGFEPPLRHSILEAAWQILCEGTE